MQDATAASGHGVTFSLGGDVVDLAETPYGGASDGIGTAAAAIVLLLAFGSVLAMGLPVLTALAGIGTGLALIALIGHLIPAPVVQPDRGLHDRAGHRRGLRPVSGHPVPRGAAVRGRPEAALVTTMQTAGRSVLTAGTTVAIGMLGLLVLRQSLLNGVAVAAAADRGDDGPGRADAAAGAARLTGTRLARPSRLRLPAARPGRAPGPFRDLGLRRRSGGPRSCSAGPCWPPRQRPGSSRCSRRRRWA